MVDKNKQLTDLRIELGLLQAKCGMLYDDKGNKVGPGQHLDLGPIVGVNRP